MPEILLPVFVFYLVYLYFSTKPPRAANEYDGLQKPATQPIKSDNVAETKPQTAKPTPMPSDKPKAKTPEPILRPSVSKFEAKPNTEAPTQKSPAKTPSSLAPKSTLGNPGLSVFERVGLTAGNLWHYLDKNGASPIANLNRDLPEEEKIIQRSIGWLAQEGKIRLENIDRVEIISLIKE